MRHWLKKISFSIEVEPNTMTWDGYLSDEFTNHLNAWVTFCGVSKKTLKKSTKKISFRVAFSYILNDQDIDLVRDFKDMVKKHPKTMFYALKTIHESGIKEAKQVMLKYYGSYKYSNRIRVSKKNMEKINRTNIIEPKDFYNFEFLSHHIGDFDIPSHIVEACEKNDIITLKDLCSLSKKEFLEKTGLKKKDTNWLEEFLQSVNCCFGMDFESPIDMLDVLGRTD